MAAVAKVRYRHDEGAEIVETDIVVLAGAYTMQCSGMPVPHVDPKSALRTIHSSMIWRVNTLKGGFVETYAPDAEKPTYSHPADDLKRHEKKAKAA